MSCTEVQPQTSAANARDTESGKEYAAAFMQEVVVYLGAIDALKLLHAAIESNSDPRTAVLATELERVIIDFEHPSERLGDWLVHDILFGFKGAK